MRLLLLLCLNIFCFGLHAGEFNFTYQYKARETSFSLELYELSKHFEEKNFSRMSAAPLGNLPLVHADEVLTSSYHPGTIFIKLGLLAPESQRFKLLTSGNLTLFHTDSLSIAFFDFNSFEVQTLIEGLATKKVSKTSVMDFFIPKASAADQVFCQTQAVNAFKNIESLNNKITQSLLIKKLGECGLHALRGATGQIDEMKNFFGTLASDPGKLWREMKENFKQLQLVLGNLTNELMSFYNTVTGLSVDDMLKIGCQMIGEIGTNLALAASGAGLTIGATKLLMITLPKLQRLKRMLELSRSKKISKETAMESLSCGI